MPSGGLAGTAEEKFIKLWEEGVELSNSGLGKVYNQVVGSRSLSCPRKTSAIGLVCSGSFVKSALFSFDICFSFRLFLSLQISIMNSSPGKQCYVLDNMEYEWHGNSGEISNSRTLEARLWLCGGGTEERRNDVDRSNILEPVLLL